MIGDYALRGKSWWFGSLPYHHSGPSKENQNKKKQKKQVLVLSWKISKFNDITQWENYLQFQIEERARLSSGQSYEPLPVLADQPNNKSKS